jgi:hypothetical protein
MPLQIIWNVSGEVKHATFTHQIVCIFVYHIVYSASAMNRLMLTYQYDSHID